MALLFIAFTVLIMLLLLVATVYYVPKALSADEEPEDNDGPAAG
jgi:hypothetical protein